MVGLILWSPFCRCGKAVDVAAYQPTSEASEEKICPTLSGRRIVNICPVILACLPSSSEEERSCPEILGL